MSENQPPREPWCDPSLGSGKELEALRAEIAQLRKKVAEHGKELKELAQDLIAVRDGGR